MKWVLGPVHSRVPWYTHQAAKPEQFCIYAVAADVRDGQGVNLSRTFPKGVNEFN